MSEKRSDAYFVAMMFLMAFALLTYLFINNITTVGWNSASVVLLIIDVPFGLLGFGTFLKHDTFAPVALRFAEFLKKTAESKGDTSSSYNRQTQVKSSGSVQVVADHEAKVKIDMPKGEKEASKIFSCPLGHPNKFYPPDDNHPLASLEEDHADEYAIGSVIKRIYKCKKCRRQITLYWYREGSF